MELFCSLSLSLSPGFSRARLQSVYYWAAPHTRGLHFEYEEKSSHLDEKSSHLQKVHIWTKKFTSGRKKFTSADVKVHIWTRPNGEKFQVPPGSISSRHLEKSTGTAPIQLFSEANWLCYFFATLSRKWWIFAFRNFSKWRPEVRRSRWSKETPTQKQTCWWGRRLT